KVDRALSGIEVDAFRAEDVQVAPSTFEGRTLLTLKGEWRKERRDVAPNALFVPIAQPKSRLVLTLLEPKDPDSFVRWGFFNAAFERKEYMEAYVAEEVATEMLKKDPAVRREFERKLAEDPEFAKDPSARLDFFYRRHPSWDEQYNLYPVLRVDQAP
ncbi:MAG: peptidase M14, partial [Xanthomonadaceae bacterium]|nr:peptidase M14 [Xanthomonadaceae bacterium]